jgi:hypothetical protein
MFHTTNSPLLTISTLQNVLEKHWHLIESDLHGLHSFPRTAIDLLENPSVFSKETQLSLQPRL